MKVKFYVEDRGGVRHLSAESDCYCVGIDVVQLIVVSEFSDTKCFDEISRLVEAGSGFSWFGKTTRVECDNQIVRIYTPASYNDEHVSIERKVFMDFLLDWKRFSRNEQEFIKDYPC